MSDLDREICGEATDGGWYDHFVDSKGRTFVVSDSYDPDDPVCVVDTDPNAAYIAHFNPQKVTQMLDELEAKDKRIEELESALRVTLSFCPSGYVPSGLDPTFYHTLNYEKEVELHIRLDAAMELLK